MERRPIEVKGRTKQHDRDTCKIRVRFVQEDKREERDARLGRIWWAAGCWVLNWINLLEFLVFPLEEEERVERSNRAALFDGIEEGGIRASSSYASHEMDEQENEKAMDGLQDRVNLLKRLSGDIHEEVDTHNRMLDRMGNDMDSSRGVLSGTMDKFKMVFETKSSQRMFTLVASFVVLFLVVYFLTR
uniref:Bet1-like snare 1-1 n=2 Tax=Solanum tuberosum TaxID=4113 RepID=M1D3V1_SOLTU